MPAIISLPIVERTEFDHSILSTHSRCPRLALYNYALNRRGGSSPSAKFGSAYHKFRYTLESLHKQLVEIPGQNLEQQKYQILAGALAVVLDGWEDPPLEAKHSYLDRDRLLETCKAGFDIWLNEKQLGAIKVIQSEIPVVLTLPNGRRYGGKIDQAVEWNGKPWVRDFKCSSYLYKDQAERYKLHHQFTGYSWIFAEMSGRPVEGVLVEFVHNTKNDGPDIIPMMSTRSDLDIQNFLEWAQDEIESYERHAATNIWPQYTRSCNDFSGCFFREACKKSSWGEVENWLIDNTEESRWDFMESED